MVTWKEYKQKPESYWKGKKIRTLIKMENGNIVIPQGTILIIDRKYKGFTLTGIKDCPHCGIGRKLYISRVTPIEVEMVTQI